MSKLHKRFQIILSVLIISSITCRMPGSTSSPEEETATSPGNR